MLQGWRHSWVLIAVRGNSSVGRVLMPAGLGCRKYGIVLLSCVDFHTGPLQSAHL